MTDKTSDSGIWIDDATGKVVKKAPERGTQLVRPGGTITGYAQARIDALDADPDAKPIPAYEALGNPAAAEGAEPVQDDASDPKPVTSPKKATSTTRKS